MWKIIRLQPGCQCKKFKRRQSAGRCACESELVWCRLRDFRDRVAEQRADFIDQFVSGGIAVKLLVPCPHERELSLIQLLRQPFSGDFPMVENKVWRGQSLEQFRRQRLASW